MITIRFLVIIIIPIFQPEICTQHKIVSPRYAMVGEVGSSSLRGYSGYLRYLFRLFNSQIALPRNRKGEGRAGSILFQKNECLHEASLRSKCELLTPEQRKDTLVQSVWLFRLFH